MENRAKINGYILTGGKSSRMGTDKAMLIFNNLPLVKHIESLISPLCEVVAISGSKPDYFKFGMNVIPDFFEGIGPISGIYSLLKQTSSEWNLVISVDTPFVNAELLESLIENIGPYHCIIPMHYGGFEPLVALYHISALPIVEQMIRNEKFKLMHLLSELNTRFVDSNELIKKYPRLFMNINSMEDYQSI